LSQKPFIVFSKGVYRHTAFLVVSAFSHIIFSSIFVSWGPVAPLAIPALSALLLYTCGHFIERCAATPQFRMGVLC